MKIEIIQEQLLAGLNIVSRAVASRAQLPALSHILIEAKDEGLALSATDLEIGIRTTVAAKVVEPGKVAVPAKMFSEFLSSLNPGKVEIKSEGDSISIVAPGYRGKFQVIDASEFPEMPELSSSDPLCKINSSELLLSVPRVVFASAKDTLRPVLTGVLWEFSKKKLRLVSTDGFRLAVEEMKVETNVDQLNLLVPARVVMEVVRMGGDGEVVVGHLPQTSQIYFLAGGVQIISQLLAGNFPDYGKILPKEFTTEIAVSKSELLQAIKATHIFARDNSNMVRWQISENKLILLSSSPEKGDCSVEVPVKLTGDDLEVVFNAKYVLDYLTIVENDELWVGMGGKLSPGMMKDLKRNGGQYVVMPINA